MAKRLPRHFNCPTEFTLAVLGGKWKTVILCYLKERPCRYAELRKLLPTLSDKMLTERLADLVRTGLVTRKGSHERGRTYALTARGRSLERLLHELYGWGMDHAATFNVQVEEPLKKALGLLPEKTKLRR